MEKIEYAYSNQAGELPPAKKVKVEPVPVPIPSSVIVNFTNGDNARAGPPVDLPVSSTAKQVEILVNSLLDNENTLPYAFYVNDVEVVTTLEEALKQLEGVNYEEILNISYQPLSVYRVRPVTRCTETMPGHTDAVVHLSYSPDGKRLASGGGDMAVRFWNVISSTPQHTCTGHMHHVLCTGWTPNGALFISADRIGEIRRWEPATGKPHGQPLRGHRKWVTSLAFEPLHVDVECTRMASSSKDSTVKVWNLKTGLCETTISGHLDSVECVKWGGAGLLYTASRDRTIKVWAIDGSGPNMQKLVRTLSGHAHRINHLALNCDYITRTGDFEIGRERSQDKAEMQAYALQRYNTLIGADGERLISCSDDFTLFLWKPQEDKNAVLRMVGHQGAVNQIAFSPDSRYIASASFDKKVKIWCGKTGKFLSTLTGHVGAVYQVAWSADSSYIASASKDSTVKVWSIKNPKKAMHTLAGHEDEVYTLDWSPNGSQLASGGKDRTIKIWHH
ncbi:notchless family protein putative [Ochromonadaceae sp. CCMP2298]|nr:notchless family protein putative [Ochromonadaceae sp. CCMP2298]